MTNIDRQPIDLHKPLHEMTEAEYTAHIQRLRAGLRKRITPEQAKAEADGLRARRSKAIREMHRGRNDLFLLSQED